MVYLYRKTLSLAGLVIAFALLVVSPLPLRAVADADTSIPPTWNIVSDDFESGNLNAWLTVSPSNLSLTPGVGHNGSTGLSVTVGQQQSYIYQRDIALAEEGYLTFWFDPNGVSIPDQGTTWIPGKSIRIGGIKGSDGWELLVGLWVRRPQGQGYKAYVEWQAPDGRHVDFGAGEFALVDGWQKITLGYRVDDWIAVWVNDTLVREITGISHTQSLGDIIEIGKASSNSAITPSGTMRFDDVAFQIPRVQDLWVDTSAGNDSNDGQTPGAALRTIQAAATLAMPGTTVHVQPGVYREKVWPYMDGTSAEPIIYVAENGPGTAVIRGSEPAASLNWTRLTSNSIGLPSGVDPTKIYYTDLTAWNLTGPPRFIAELGSGGEVNARLPLAREPDWQVTTDWKHHEYWWAADGGWSVAGCDPSNDSDRDCDEYWRSTTQLTDRNNDSSPAGIQPGNLTTLGNLTGGTLTAVDSRQGHYVYRRSIVAHDVSAGRITVNEPCEDGNSSGATGLGWGSKYYVEGKPGLLDTPGEWWYDTNSRRLYLWPPSPGDPSGANLEISRRDTGFELSHRSDIVLDGLKLEFFNESAILQVNSATWRSYRNVVQNATVRYANHGVYIDQGTGTDVSNITDGFQLTDSEIGHIDTLAIFVLHWWPSRPDPAGFTHAGVVNTVIRNNEIHHVGFRSDRDNPYGVLFPYASQLRFEGNHIHDIAQNGVQFNDSVIQSSKTYGFDPGEIMTGEILVKDNLFEKACLLTADCGGLKFAGDPPDSHVFRDVLVTGNVIRDTMGWARTSELRGRWSGGVGSQVRGMGGKGLFIDMASGIAVYRNIAYNNSFVGFLCGGDWRDGDILLYNNIAANSLHGFRLDGPSYDTHGGSLNTKLVNNIVLNNEGYGLNIVDNDGEYGNLTVDHNLYFNNGWRPYDQGGLYNAGDIGIWLDNAPGQQYQTLAEIQAGTPWEDHGRTGDPFFSNYDVSDHEMHDGSWPDFHLTAQSSNAIDRGTTSLPQSLTDLLTLFGVEDSTTGPAFDIGRHEYGQGFVKTSDILVVADHEPGSSNPQVVYFTQALGDLGQAYDLWDTGIRGAPGTSILSQYSDGIIIWSLPEQTGHLANASVQENLQSYLDGGGKLLISGQNVAKIANGSTFLQAYLHAAFVQDFSGTTNVSGVGADPVGNGLSLSIGGSGGADNQSSPDVIESSGPAWPVFFYGDAGSGVTAGLRVNSGVYRLVFLAFGLEGIDRAVDRATVMQRSLDWLAGSSAVVEVNLSSGWNLSSWPVEPLMPGVEGALRTLEGRYCRVIGEVGVYDCGLNPVYHTLTELYAGNAYYLHLGGSGSADLWMEGALLPPDNPIALHQGWNWVGYLSSGPLPVATALESIQGRYLMVHGIDKTYNPSEPLYSTLTHLEPGQGYLIYATEATTLVYPGSALSVQAALPTSENDGACDDVSPTPYFAVLHGEITLGTSPAPPGTVIEVLDPSGSTTGCFVVQHSGHYGYMHLYGYEGADLPTPGFRQGDPLTVRVNGAPASTPMQLTWSNDPTPIQANLHVALNAAHLPLIRRSQ